MGIGTITADDVFSERVELQPRTSDPSGTEDGEGWVRSDVTPKTDQIGTLRFDTGSGTVDLPIFDTTASTGDNVETHLRVPVGNTRGFVPTTDDGAAIPKVGVWDSGVRYGAHDSLFESSGVFAMGGFSGSTLATVERYDTSWTAIGDMPTARFDFAAAQDDSGNIYAIGGIDSSALATVERWTANNWTAIADMPTARYDLAATRDGSGNIYAIGGIDKNNNTVATVEQYDGNSWSSIADLPTARFGLAAASSR